MADSVSAKTLVFCDLSRGYFIKGRYDKSINNSPFDLFFSRNTLNLEVYPLVLNPAAAYTEDPFSVVDVSGLSLVASIYDSTGATLLASQSTFSTDVNLGILTGTLNCDTVAMGTAVTTDPTQVLIEFRFTGSAGWSKNVRASGSTTVIRKQFNVTGTPAALAGAYYPTLDEVRAMFLERDGTAGASYTLKSADGTKRVVVYLDNSGVVREDPVS